jgi:hypothetical protein
VETIIIWLLNHDQSWVRKETSHRLRTMYKENNDNVARAILKFPIMIFLFENGLYDPLPEVFIYFHSLFWMLTPKKVREACHDIILHYLQNIKDSSSVKRLMPWIISSFSCDDGNLLSTGYEKIKSNSNIQELTRLWMFALLNRNVKLRDIAQKELLSLQSNALSSIPCIPDMADAFVIPANTLSKAASLDNIPSETYRDPRDVSVTLILILI